MFGWQVTRDGVGGWPVVGAGHRQVWLFDGVEATDRSRWYAESFIKRARELTSAMRFVLLITSLVPCSMEHTTWL